MEEREASWNAIYFILLTILIDAIGFGLIIPVMPALLKELVADSSPGSESVWGGYLIFVYAAMIFLCGPLIGSLSDRFGRRPVLLLALGSLALDNLIMGVTQSLAILFIGRLISGICGATFSTANAYIADVVPKEKRAHAFGLVGAAFSVGFILGPAVGGMLGQYNPRVPFFAAAILSVANMAYGVFVLPESLPPRLRRPMEWSRIQPFNVFAYSAKLTGVTPLLVMMLLYQLAHGVYQSTWSFHGAERYGWGADQIGNSLMAFGISNAIVQGGIIRIFLRRFGPTMTAYLGLACNIVAFIGYSTAPTAMWLYCFIPIAALGAITSPAVNSILSARTGADRQGELQGALASMSGIANMISPIMMTQVFALFARNERHPFYGAAFLLAAGLTACAVPLLWSGTRSDHPLDQPA
jgi:DHA1 family tetracycline resistance protein-like MFS transporter